MEEQIYLYIKNINKSINLTIQLNRLSTILDLKLLVANKLDNIYPCFFKLVKGTNDLDNHLGTLLTDCNIENENTLYLMGKLNKERAVLNEWFRQDGHNWCTHNNWGSNEPLSEWFGITTNEEGKIIRIQMDSNNINSIPSELSQLQKLEKLDLYWSKINNIPSELSQLQNLKILHLSFNKINNIPSELSQLQNLKTLDLSGNEINNIPPELSQLQNLKTLDLSGNEINNIPSELSQL